MKKLAFVFLALLAGCGLFDSDTEKCDRLLAQGH